MIKISPSLKDFAQITENNFNKLYRKIRRDLKKTFKGMPKNITEMTMEEYGLILASKEICDALCQHLKDFFIYKGIYKKNILLFPKNISEGSKVIIFPVRRFPLLNIRKKKKFKNKDSKKVKKYRDPDYIS